METHKHKSNTTMKKTISIQINLNKIDKSRLYKGDKGTYLNGIIFLNDEEDQYGNNGFVCESVSKEERDKGVRGEILGNVKVLGGKEKVSEDSGNSGPELDSNFNDMQDDLPFAWLLLPFGFTLMQIIGL